MWKDEGFLQGNADVASAMNRLEKYLASVPEQYKDLPGGELIHKISPLKWSNLEILGHLIDSALNNLKRFTEIQFLTQPYSVISYRQDDLVAVNNYQRLPLEHLLSLWRSLNAQIVYVVKNIPVEKFDYPVDPQYDNREMKTLAWIICDYVSHMEHHLRQLFTETFIEII